MLLNSKLTSQETPPTHIQTPVPCRGHAGPTCCYGGYIFEHEFPEWSTEAKYKKICTDQFQPPEENLGFCCYWIVYHDRIRIDYDIQHNPVYIYETNVTGIIYEGEGCKKRTQGEIIHNFQRLHYDSVSNVHPEYAPWCGGIMQWDGQRYQHKYQVYSTGRCVDSTGANCDNHQFCCQYDKTIYWVPTDTSRIGMVTLHYSNGSPIKDDFHVYYMDDSWNGSDSTFSEHYVPCNCISKCDEVLMVSNNMKLCESPCDDDKWTVPSQSPRYVPIANCPGCSVKVEYKFRLTSPCPEAGMNSFQDIWLDQIEIDSTSPCNNCSITLQSIHQQVVDYLLLNAFETYPQPGQSSTFYRIFKSACWADFFDEGWNQRYLDSNNNYQWIWHPSQRILRKCDSTNCCWYQYKLTTMPGGIHTYEVINSYSTKQDCILAPYPCIFLCGDE